MQYRRGEPGSAGRPDVRRLLPEENGVKREFDIFCAALFAAACAILLYQLPAWLIPNRWTDVSAWKAVSEPVYEQWRQWLAISPTGKDIRIKICIAKPIRALCGEALSFFLLAHAACKRKNK